MIGEILVSSGVVTETDLALALEKQKASGGRLGDILIGMSKISQEQLTHVLDAVPLAPLGLDETGITMPELLNLLTKTMYAGSVDTIDQLSEAVRLPHSLSIELVEEARERQLVEIFGGTHSHMRFGLSGRGKEWAQQALDKCAYVGPAPVSYDAYVSRIRRQSIGNERVPPSAVARAFTNMIMSDDLTSQIGPAINSGRSILLYGPPGNGKTSVAERIGNIFQSVVYIPHCFQIGGQIIKVFDPAIHKETSPPMNNQGENLIIRKQGPDQRWVPCQRPFVVTGGELTLEMLDLSFDSTVKFYEAPLHVKALNGTFLVDDFGRQIVSPETLLNRWIVPLESRVDYLKLHTGKSLMLPFDELVIFSTNMAPNQLMDPAFLRRIPYKIEVGAPNIDEYRRIFRAASGLHAVNVSDENIDFVIHELTERNDLPLAGFQPNFILGQVIAACKYYGIAPECRPEALMMAIKNLYTKDNPGYGMVQSRKE